MESRERPIDVGKAGLRHHAGALARRREGWTIDRFCDELPARIAPRGDDVALLALRLPAAPGGPEPTPPSRPPYGEAAPDRAAPGCRRRAPDLVDPMGDDPARKPGDGRTGHGS